MRNEKIRWLTFDAMALAIIAVLALVPYWGFIKLGPLSITILHVPVLIFAYFGGIKRGWLYGLMFGIMSLIRCTYPPYGDLDVYCINPLISVLPRVIFGFLAGLVFEYVKKIKNKTGRYATVLGSSIVLTFVHTILFISMLALIYIHQIEAAYDSTFGILLVGTIVSGSLPECAVAAILTPLVTFALTPLFNNIFQVKEIERR